MKRIISLLLVSISLCVVANSNDNRLFAYGQNIEVFSSVLKQLNINYVDTIDVDK